MNFYKLFSRIFFHFLSASFSIERTFRNYFRNAQRESIIVTNIPLSPFLALENRRRIKKKKITSQRLLAARQLVTVSHYTIRESFIRKEKLVALRSFYPFIRFEPPGGRYYSVSPRYFKFTPIGMRLSLCNSFSPSPSPPLFLSLCVAASIEARRISLEQRWLFAIVATMHGDIGFSEKERPFRGWALWELRPIDSDAPLSSPPLNKSRQVRLTLATRPRWRLFCPGEGERNGDWPNVKQENRGDSCRFPVGESGGDEKGRKGSLSLSVSFQFFFSLFLSFSPTLFFLYPFFLSFFLLYFFPFIPVPSVSFFRISLACFLGCARVGELKLFTSKNKRTSG